MIGTPTESRYPTKRLPPAAAAGTCAACRVRASRLALYRTPVGLVCRACTAAAS